MSQNKYEFANVVGVVVLVVVAVVVVVVADVI